MFIPIEFVLVKSGNNPNVNNRWKDKQTASTHIVDLLFSSEKVPTADKCNVMGGSLKIITLKAARQRILII